MKHYQLIIFFGLVALLSWGLVAPLVLWNSQPHGKYWENVTMPPVQAC
jgi:hypothetical protein